ncbi:MAG: YggS family pyridoxal phosphate-dependent enzyme [candidate division KSB1 bacterium]|nr:YggS family pyridoxal phosphate-dependent enzyme [candidate division KSB1 bacterium]MDZ7303457.1 YggS family pyridoxal phosphate-dependent enzyme [candidate division KSB1 bacterium]MDZ7312539.1 YggS family pyridoxal phosphate-dependent enzyme [candidate division KSB1 bacterium]
MPIDAIPFQKDIRVRIEAVRQRMAAACERVGRDPAEVTLVAVTKTVPPAAIKAAYDAGLRCFGENRVQEAATKISPTFLREGGNEQSWPQWHLIGHLQTNKAKKAVELFQVIQSVDSLHLAEALQRHAAVMERRVEVFIEVNTSGEPTKFGVSPDQTLQLVKAVAELPNLQLTGLMTIGALTDKVEIIRRCFQQLRELQAEINAKISGVNLRHLSMGMTDDFELAIEAGSTMVRIGRAIFGERT